MQQGTPSLQALWPSVSYQIKDMLYPWISLFQPFPSALDTQQKSKLHAKKQNATIRQREHCEHGQKWNQANWAEESFV